MIQVPEQIIMTGLPHTRPLDRRAVLGLSVSGLAALAGCGDANNTGEPSESGPDNSEEPNESETEDEAIRERNLDGGTERSDASTLLNIRDTLDTDNPLFDPQSKTFTSDASAGIDAVPLRSAFTVVAFEHDGEENFIVETDGSVGGLVVNSPDTTGAVCFAADSGDYDFAVATERNWSMTVGQPFAPPEEIRTPSVSASGDGHAVVGPIELAETTTFIGEHESDGGNFVVEVYNEDASGGTPDEVVFNQIGEFSGEARADPAGIAWLEIEADGVWRLEIK